MNKSLHRAPAVLIIVILSIVLVSCQNEKNNESNIEIKIEDTNIMLPNDERAFSDTIILSKKHNPNSISCDLDGDKLTDRVTVVQNTVNEKYGLKIIFGNKKVAYLGMGKDVLGQGFDDIGWVGIFEKVSKGETYYNNVSEEGEILSEDEIDEKDLIKLPNDGIFIHQEESCGGGIIYLKNGKFEWIQQE